MSAPINLNRARKQRVRQEARRKADENAAKHGLKKAQRQRDTAESERERARLDGHRVDDPER